MEFSGKKIILTGYRACGKTSVGKILAAKLGLDFIDMDKVLEERYGSIRQMVEDQGWDFFRARERELLDELTGRDNLVVATGGGAIMHHPQWQRLMDTGLTVWLTGDVETICRRLAADLVSAEQRPSLTGQDIRDEVAGVLAEREPFYRQGSHLTVDGNMDLADIVLKIENFLQGDK
ncbi:MAG: shikimate kinase [Proteobacteria bacterium]|nr:shikimate kinase [Pseudomonadota bacterium]MBU1716920.1 shikimate kinase [Pseudomonadota bacterium]